MIPPVDLDAVHASEPTPTQTRLPDTADALLMELCDRYRSLLVRFAEGEPDAETLTSELRAADAVLARALAARDRHAADASKALLRERCAQHAATADRLRRELLALATTERDAIATERSALARSSHVAEQARTLYGSGDRGDDRSQTPQFVDARR